MPRKKPDHPWRWVYREGGVRVLTSEEAAAQLFLRVWRAQGLKYSQRYGLGVEKQKGRPIGPAHEGRATDYLTVVRWLQQNWHRYPERDLTKLLNKRVLRAYLHVRRERNQGEVGNAQALDGQFSERGGVAAHEGVPVVTNRLSRTAEIESDDDAGVLSVLEIALAWGAPADDEGAAPNDEISDDPIVGTRPYAFQPPALYPPDVARQLDVREAIGAERRHPDYDPRDLSALWLRVQWRWSWEAIAKDPAFMGLTPEAVRKRVARTMDRLANRLRAYAPVRRRDRIAVGGTHRRRFVELAYIERAIGEGSYSRRTDGERPARGHAAVAERDRAFKVLCAARWTFYAPDGTFMHEQLFNVLTKYDQEFWAWNPQDPGLPIEVYPDDPDDIDVPHPDDC